MKPRSKAALLLLLIFVLSGWGIYWSEGKIRSLAEARAAKEALYLDSPKAIARLSLGYTGLSAQIYWIRVIQYFGEKHLRRARSYPLLYPLLIITTSLDPHLAIAYEFGSTFLAQTPPEGAGMPDKAAEFVEKGIQENPTNWKLYYQLGYIQYLERKDYMAAAQAFERGSKIPGAHPWMKVMAAMMATRAGQIETSRFLWSNIYESTSDEAIRRNAAKRLQALNVDQAIVRLENIVAEYRHRNGRNPTALGELIAAGMIRGIPLDPTGKPLKLTADGRIELQDPELVPFVTKGLPPGYVQRQLPKLSEEP